MCQKVLPGVVAQQVQGDVQLVMKAEYNRPASRRLGGAGAAFEDFCDAVQQFKEFGEGEPCSRVIVHRFLWLLGCLVTSIINQGNRFFCIYTRQVRNLINSGYELTSLTLVLEKPWASKNSKRRASPGIS
jgi:hypothetical protein